MKAEVGDRIVVASGTLHRPIRDGEILQVGEGGVGPYLVRWSGGSTSTSTRIRPQRRRTPYCTVMCRHRSTFGVRLVAARPIQIYRLLATRWRLPVP